MNKLKPSAAFAVLAVPLLLGGCSDDGYGRAALENDPGPPDPQGALSIAQNILKEIATF